MSLRMCLAIVGLLCLFGTLGAARAEEAPPAKSAVSVLALQYINANELAWMLTLKGVTANPGKTLRDFLPEGIEELSPLPDNRLLVVAKDREAIDQLMSLVKLLDVAPKRVIYEFMIVRLSRNDLQQLQGTPVRKPLSELIGAGKAKVMNAPRLLAGNGMPAVAQLFPEDQRPISTFPLSLWIKQTTIHPDDSVSFEMAPIFLAPAPAEPPAVKEFLRGTLSANLGLMARIRNGESLLVYEEQLTGRPLPAEQDITTVLLITPTVLKLDKADGVMELPPLF